MSLFPVKLENVTVQRKNRILLGPINLVLQDVSTTMVIGPNGAGKTTLLRALHGVERLSGGQIDWAAQTSQIQKRQAYVFQTPIMLRRSVAENLRYPLILNRVPRSTANSLVADWAAQIGLGDQMDAAATRLSGGEKQKLAVARALIQQPNVLFLDEPCANLDGASTRDIEALLTTAQKNGTRLIMATHDLGQVRRLGQDLLFIVDGKVVEHGSAKALLEAPKTDQLRSFLAGEIIG